MASDQQVSSKVILAVMMELKRQGSRPVLEHLEQVEPDLASYVMETSSLIYQRLMGMGAPIRMTRRVYRQIEDLVLVCITALRRSHYELWRDMHGAEDANGERDETPREAGGACEEI